MNYYPSQNNNPIDIINIQSLAKKVKHRMEKGAFDSIAGGGETESTLYENTAAFDRKKIIPRVLQSMSSVDLKTNFFGIPLSMPVIAAPVAAQGLLHKEAEAASALGTSASGSLFCLSTYSTLSIDQLAPILTRINWMFQIYMREDEFTEYMVQRATKYGAKAIILTVDAIVGGQRERDIKNKFVFPVPFGNFNNFYKEEEIKGKSIAEIFESAKRDLDLSHIKYLKKVSDGLPVIIKGVQSPIDANLAIDAGADGIWVSNHGGRQMDCVPASFEVLPSITKAVNKRVPIILDGGIIRGHHVFKALASYADIVAIGRPFVYGLNLGGSQGVTSVFNHYAKELTTTMYLAGTQTLKDITPDYLMS